MNGKITDMNENGVGIAKLDGCIVFVNGAVTGDVGEIEITERKKNYAFGEMVNLAEPSPLRCEADCPSYDKCGGCTLRHISFETENQVKRQAVANAFRRAGLREVTVNETMHTEEKHYRNKAVFHYSPKGFFGYYSEKTNETANVLPCPLLPNVFNEIGCYINGLLPNLPKLGFRSLYLRGTVCGDISVIFGMDGKDASSKLMKSGLIPSLVSRFPMITGILSESGGSYSVLYGEKELSDTLMGLRFAVSPEGFWQVNHTAAELLAEKVLGYAKEVEFDTCIDLYCGSGTFGLILSSALREKGGKYYGVELNERSIYDAKRNAAANGIGNITFFCGDAADFRKKIGAESLGAALAVIDPPRAGCSAEMLRNLVDLAPKEIIYISCSPNTLARDCAKLAEAGYAVVEATPVNLFPRTKHCECVVKITRQLTTHNMKLNPSPFEMIKSGEKTIELRLFDEKRQSIKTGDTIVFTNTESRETLTATVIKLHRFDSFHELYRGLPLLQCGYTRENIDKATPADMEQYYSAEEQTKYGVVGIELRLL